MPGEDTGLSERETGFGPANSSLEGYCLTTWRLPQSEMYFNGSLLHGQDRIISVLNLHLGNPQFAH